MLICRINTIMCLTYNKNIKTKRRKEKTKGMR
jgi:hypothetical protein